MEDILALYEAPYDPLEPVVCLDEKPVPCLEDKRHTVHVRNGSVRRDYEYVRRRTANVCCGVELKAGRYFTKVTKARGEPDVACMPYDAPRFSDQRTAERQSNLRRLG